ncbi:MAG: cytochrome c oxidase subunit 3, partial [Candidatus Binatia bacterium]|nr:cytochrome c oxidase subunit 3 [Candidatus Binatia bacterium]
LFGSFYYTLTGLHAIHIIGGVGVLLYILYEGSKGRYGPDNYDRVECVGLYWHFVDLVWVILFPILYLL